ARAASRGPVRLALPLVTGDIVGADTPGPARLCDPRPATGGGLGIRLESTTDSWWTVVRREVVAGGSLLDRRAGPAAHAPAGAPAGVVRRRRRAGRAGPGHAGRTGRPDPLRARQPERDRRRPAGLPRPRLRAARRRAGH